jgi:hypothetical protein
MWKQAGKCAHRSRGVPLVRAVLPWWLLAARSRSHLHLLGSVTFSSPVVSPQTNSLSHSRASVIVTLSWPQAYCSSDGASNAQ